MPTLLNMRTAVVGLLVACLATSVGCTAKPKPTPVPPPGGGAGVRVTITAAKPEFAPGEPVVLHVRLTNVERGSCKVLGVPDAALAILDATRDGAVVVPAFSTGTYIDGMSSYLSRNLVEVKPDGSVDYDLVSERAAPADDRPALEVSTLDASDQSNSSYWPVDEPGRYELAARYLPAEVTGGLCHPSGDPVAVSFVVSGG